MEKLYDDLEKAVAFELRFTNMIFTYYPVSEKTGTCPDEPDIV